MLKRYTLTLAALLLLLSGGVLLNLAPWFVYDGQVDIPDYEQFCCLWTALVFLVVIVSGNMALKKIWFFRGTGDPVAAQQVRERLLAINDMDCPVTVKAWRKKMILTWRHADPLWCTLFSRWGMQWLYELHCRIDPKTRTLYLVDRIRAVTFVDCPEHRVKIGWPRMCLPVLRSRLNRLRTIEQYAILEAYEYDFHPREIKSPVLGTILACGWNVRFSLF